MKILLFALALVLVPPAALAKETCQGLQCQTETCSSDSCADGIDTKELVTLLIVTDVRRRPFTSLKDKRVGLIKDETHGLPVTLDLGVTSPSLLMGSSSKTTDVTFGLRMSL